MKTNKEATEMDTELNRAPISNCKANESCRKNKENSNIFLYKFINKIMATIISSAPRYSGVIGGVTGYVILLVPDCLWDRWVIVRFWKYSFWMNFGQKEITSITSMFELDKNETPVVPPYSEEWQTRHVRAPITVSGSISPISPHKSDTVYLSILWYPWVKEHLNVGFPGMTLNSFDVVQDM